MPWKIYLYFRVIDQYNYRVGVMLVDNYLIIDNLRHFDSTGNRKLDMCFGLIDVITKFELVMCSIHDKTRNYVLSYRNFVLIIKLCFSNNTFH